MMKMNFALINLYVLFVAIKSVQSESDQLINFVPETNDFDLIASESISNQYSSVLDLTTDEYLNECVQAHNEKRRLHGVDDLVYDEKLLSDAKEAAFQSALNNKLTRIEDSAYGENLAASTKRLLCTNAVNLWYKQAGFYNYHVPRYSKQTGSFTQLVWRETKSVACAQARLKTGSRYFSVCLYHPFGNISGQFRSNVLPPIMAANRPIGNSENVTTNQPTIGSSSFQSTTSKPTSTESDWSVSPNAIPNAIPNVSPNVSLADGVIGVTNEDSSSENHSFSSSTDNPNGNPIGNPISSPPESELPNEATLNVSPQESPNDQPRPITLVKPILNKSYRLSPGMLIKLKNLNKLKFDASSDKNATAVDKIEASASELNTFIKLNTISPTLDTMEISNLISRKNETTSSAPTTETKPSLDDLWTTTRPL